MIVGPRYKICKRLGNGVFEKCQTQKFALSESRRTARKRQSRPRSLSDYGRQLLEKQRVRYTYGISEKQLSKYVRSLASKKNTEPTSVLLATLETRLDNVVYRLGLAKTRRGARQMVAHGHIRVNNKKVTIPSYQVKVSDTVSVREKSQTSPLFADLVERSKDLTHPNWLTFNVKKMEGALKQIPSKDSVETAIDFTGVMEFYSR